MSLLSQLKVFSFLTLGLRDQPLVDEELRIAGEAQEELPVRLHRVDRLHGLVDARVQRLDLLKIPQKN